jgi:antitoxin (DNA-binding transcriptional repressor) of toxin-antitoxin stability system
VATDPTITASEFKAKCLGLFDQLGARKLKRLCVTKRGRVVAIVTPPDEPQDLTNLHGFMRGSVIAPNDFDLTAPALDEPLDAERPGVRE